MTLYNRFTLALVCEMKVTNCIFPYVLFLAKSVILVGSKVIGRVLKTKYTYAYCGQVWLNMFLLFQQMIFVNVYKNLRKVVKLDFKGQ